MKNMREHLRKRFTKGGETHITIESDPEESAKHEKQKTKPSKLLSSLKKHIAKSHGDVTYATATRNCWKSKMHYLLFCANIGNDISIFPITMRLALGLSSGVFMIALVLSSILLVMPMMYSEIFLGRYSKLTNGQMYKMVPFSFGFSIVITLVNIAYYPIMSIRLSQYLTSILRILIRSNIFKICPTGKDTESCYDYKKRGPLTHLNCSYGYMSTRCSDGQDYRYPVQFMYWKHLKNMSAGVNYPTWQFFISIVLCWIMITALATLGMKVLGLMLKLFYIIYMLVMTVVFVMSITTQGGTDGFGKFLEIKFQNTTFVELIILLSFSFRKLGMVIPTGYMTYSAYTKFSRFGPSTEALLIVVLNMCQTLFCLALFYTISGVMARNMGIPIKTTLVPYEGLQIAMTTEFLTFKDCPNLFFVAYYLFSWALEVIKLAISMNWFLMNLFDFFPQMRNFESYIRIGLGIVLALLSLICVIEIVSVIVIPLLASGHALVTIALEMFIESALLYYCYGVNRLSDDIQFVSGKRPIRFWKIMWYLLPIICLMQIITLVFNYKYNLVMDIDIIDHPKHIKHINILATGAITSAIVLSMSLLISFLYIMISFQQSKLAINVLKPHFFWGPPKTEMRVARKLFAPRTAIRSQSNRKRKIRFRKHSIKQMREKDLAEGVKRGRIFLDNMFFSNIAIGARKVQVIMDDNAIK